MLLISLLGSFCIIHQVLGVQVIQSFDYSLKESFVKAHNDLRSQVSNPQAANMQMMSWDDELAVVAQANVKQCVMRHTPTKDRKTNTFPQIGENLYERTNKDLENIAQVAVPKWYGEIDYYHFENRSCDEGKMCGHYTQVIWATSVKVGCAIATCDGSDSTYDGILVCCNYGPAGNVVKRGGIKLSPYKPGEPCSECNEGQQCEDQLCYTPDESALPTPEKENTTTPPPVTTLPPSPSANNRILVVANATSETNATSTLATHGVSITNAVTGMNEITSTSGGQDTYQINLILVSIVGLLTCLSLFVDRF